MSAAGSGHGNYTQFANDVFDMWTNGEISDSAFKVYFDLARRMYGKNACEAKQADIAANIKKSLPTVKRALTELETLHLISRQAQYEKGERMPSLYTLLPVAVKKGIAHSSELSLSPNSAKNELSPRSSSELSPSSSRVSYQEQDSVKDSVKETNNRSARASEGVVAYLLCEGVEESQAQRLAKLFSVERIMQQIHWLPSRKYDKNKAGFLVKAIERDYAAPPGCKRTVISQAAQIAAATESVERERLKAERLAANVEEAAIMKQKRLEKERLEKAENAPATASGATTGAAQTAVIRETRPEAQHHQRRGPDGEQLTPEEHEAQRSRCHEEAMKLRNKWRPQPTPETAQELESQADPAPTTAAVDTRARPAGDGPAPPDQPPSYAIPGQQQPSGDVAQC